MKKECVAVMLPTNITGTLGFNGFVANPILQLNIDKNKWLAHQELYICSKDKIIENEWIIDNGNLRQASKMAVDIYNDSNNILPKCFKVLATTNKCIINTFMTSPSGKYHEDESVLRQTNGYGKSPIYSISNDFIQQFITAYNKGEKIEKVILEYYIDGDYEEDNDETPAKILKLNGSEIIISKAKESWNREEVIQLIKKYHEDCDEYIPSQPPNPAIWLEQNF